MPEDRYSGIKLIDWIGESGQKIIKKSSCLIIGCGALGCASSNLLVRYGFGSIKIADRDFVDLPNLERQTLFDENDARMMKPKAMAAEEKLSAVNSEVKVDGVVTDVNSGNIDRILADCDLIVDGTDNLETRYLINDACVKHKIPWIYGACLSSSGMSFNILPGGPCFRCMYVSAPDPGRTPTCESEGILPSVPQVVGAIQAAEAVKIACMSKNISRGLIHVDLAAGTFKTIAVERSDSCPACAKGHFEYLRKEKTSSAVSLCGRNSVQIVPANETTIDLKTLEKKLEAVGKVSYMGYLLNFKKKEHELVVFPDGRVIVKGTSDIGLAKSLYSRYIGN